MCCSLIGPTGGQAERTREEEQMTTVSTELHAADWEHQAQSLHVQAALEREQRQRLSNELRERRERHEALSDELTAAKAQLRQLKDVAEGNGSIREVEMADTASELQFAQSKLDDLAGQLEDSRMEREFLMQQLMQVDGGLGGADADPQQQGGEHVRQLTGERDAAVEEAATLRTDNAALGRQLDAASAEHTAMASQLQQSMTDQAELLAQVRVTFSRAAFHHLFGRHQNKTWNSIRGVLLDSGIKFTSGWSGLLQVNEANAAAEELSRNVKCLTAELLRRMELKVRTALSGPPATLAGADRYLGRLCVHVAKPQREPATRIAMQFLTGPLTPLDPTVVHTWHGRGFRATRSRCARPGLGARIEDEGSGR
jgi:hypothetical protein